MRIKAAGLCGIAIGSLTLGLAGAAEAGDSLGAALTGGKVNLDMRYRYENVSDDDTAVPPTKDANASTLRTRLGYTTGSFYDLSAMIEAENITVLGNVLYNNGIPGGKTEYSKVLDPATTEINQAFLGYAGLSDTVMNLGRQRIVLDNQRFIGDVAWRQNEQTFDAFALVNKSLPDATLTYAYLDNVNRVTGDDDPAGDARMSSHVLNASYAGWTIGTLTGYGYLLDYDAASNYGKSTQTWGLRFNGASAMSDSVKLLYTAEYARQSDYGNNPGSYGVDYLLGEIGASFSGVTARYGYESLGSDGRFAVQTPLATLHAFNGWADMFLSTPVNGLVDQYLGVGAKPMDINLAAVYHDFTADKGSSDYGTEWDLMASKTFAKMYTVGVKYASYSADKPAAGFATNVDTNKFWLWGEVKF
jgi:hypothetical protein